MLTVHSVSDLTGILSNIIQNEPTFRDVWVWGEVSMDEFSDTFTLTDGEKKLKCFMPSGTRNKFRHLLIEGQKVAVSGKIKLFPRFSEYQIHLVDMQPDGTNAVGNDQLFTLDDITGRLEEITADFSGSQQIQVRGEITRFKSPPDQPWYLSDASDKAPTGRDQKIHCFFNSDLINNTVLEDKGSAVRIQGAIRIWGAFR